MKEFLDHIVDRIEERDLAGLGDWCYVFPSKRAGTFFIEKLRGKFPDQTFWSPDVLGIEDFVCKCAGTTPADATTLIFRLYEVYKKYEPGVEFDRFYSWGQVLLADFDEIDRYLVDSRSLYSGLTSLVNLDDAFGENEELKEAYKRFVKLFSQDHSTNLMERFKTNWEIIARVYEEFTDSSDENDLLYPGRIFKKLAGQLENKEVEVPYKKIRFAGFNALSTSEETIFLNLVKEGVAEVYWDVDKLYMDDELEEAGDFLRNYKRSWPQSGVHWICSDVINEAKTLHVVGCPQLIAQAKYAGKIIKEQDFAIDTTSAIILGDENLMMPVVHSLEADNINVTMGYPFRYTSLYGLISQLMQLHSESAEDKRNTYRSSTLISLLKNTLVNPVFNADVNRLTGWIRSEKLKWVKAGEVESRCKSRPLGMLFRELDKPRDLLVRISDFLVALFYFIRESEGENSSEEVVYHGLKFLNRFRENIESLPVDTGIKFLQLSFQESSRSWKIPFSGEPLRGIQVMGVLESRALDFENIVILGMNENRIPRSSFGQSYIPFIARKAFGLPTFLEHEAIYAYHFKRVLQRAKNIYILYDTEVAVDGSGEKSRFLLQLERKLSKDAQLKIKERIIHLPFKSLQLNNPKIEIEKSPSVLEQMNMFIRNGEEASSRLSPTKLANYIDCSFRFYLREIARVPEEDPSMDKIDPRMFGIILHKTLENIYQPFIGKELTDDQLHELSRTKSIQDHVQSAMKKFNVVHSNYNVSGKDILLGSVLVRLARKIIQRDRDDAPITILGVEQFLDGYYEMNGKTIALGGNVDRIDQIEKDGRMITRIIDYKTGRVEMLPGNKSVAEDPDEYFTPYFEGGKYKSGFQAYYYATLYHQQHPSEPLKAGIYELKKVSRGTEFLRKGEILSSELLNKYREKLEDLIKELFNPEIPFRQTEDLSKCRYCAYQTICKRND